MLFLYEVKIKATDTPHIIYVKMFLWYMQAKNITHSILIYYTLKRVFLSEIQISIKTIIILNNIWGGDFLKITLFFLSENQLSQHSNSTKNFFNFNKFYSKKVF